MQTRKLLSSVIVNFRKGSIRVGNMLRPVFYDFEASGLGGFPIEVGWALVDERYNLRSDSYLILPAPEWNLDAHWDESAQEIHGISQAYLMANGRPAVEVAQRLNDSLSGMSLYSDSPFDQKWMGQLFTAAGADRTFVLKQTPAPALIEKLRAELDLTEDDVAGLYRTTDHQTPHTDRAGPDARHWAARWLALLQFPTN
jgi:hypothetical protein